MAEDFDIILDNCIDRINRGERPEDCLRDYPEQADRLGPLLTSMGKFQGTCAFTPSADAKREARQKFYATLDEREQRATAPAFFRFITRPVVWIPVVAVLALIIVGVLVARPPTPESPMLVSSPTGNFAFLISDEPNDIGDFTELNVTISSVGLQAAGGSGNWSEFTPEIKTVDLTKLQGEESQEIWRGDVEPGEYSQVFIHVSKVEGVLVSTGQTIDVKLPSNKLHISKAFEVTADAVTSFTFDITVISTGKNGKYILKPQISDSGARRD